VNAALSIAISPTSVTLDVGQSQVFTSGVSGGTSPYSYQWYLDGNAVSGATGATWTYTPSASGSHRVYVKVTDNIGKQATSNMACVTVNCQPSVTVSPSSVTLDFGQSQTFTSSVSGGTSPYSYQWYLNGVAVSGATSSYWTFTPSSTGSYSIYVEVTDSVGVTATSNTATVTVKAALSVTVSPSSVTLDFGQSQTFTSSVSGGTSPYSYQWYLNGVAVSGATGASWTFTPSSTGSYTVYVKVTDSACKQATSNTATVTVKAALSVTVSPSSVTLDVGQSQTFTSSVSGGTSPYSYQWYLNGVAVSGATGASWTFTPSSSGTYTVYVEVTDSATSPANAKSNVASVTVNLQLTVTISPPISTIYLTQSQGYTSSVSGGTSPYSYQWYVNGSAVSGATGSTWTFTPATTGTYQIYVRVTDGVGEVASSSIARLTVNPKPSMSVMINPSSAVIDLTQSVAFVSSITGGVSPYSYQWYVNGSAVSGATGSTWTFTPATAGHYQVYLNVTDSLSTKAKSNVAVVTVNSLPTVSITPTAVVMDVGQSQLFTSSVSGGTVPCSYQWYLNGVAVSGATGASWTFTPSSTGSYSIYVEVTDSVGAMATSNTATVTVNAALSVTISPSSVTVDVGQSLTFTCTVSGGTVPCSYQWYLNGVAVSGATGASWTFTPSSTGSYSIYVEVTDSVGAMATSNTATVTVNGAPSVTISPGSATLDVGQSQLFTSSVSGGTVPCSYQWYLNGVAVSGATNPTWTFTPSSSGSYSVYVNVTDSVGVRVKSNVATVTVNTAPSVTISPSSSTLDVGGSQLFTSTVSGGTSPYSYQWYLNGVAVSGATNPTWTFTPSSSGSYSVYVNVTDSVGSKARSNVAIVTVNAAPSVSISPSSVVMDVGQSRTFTSSVSGGTSPYSYQWYLNGVAVSDATNASWTFTPSSSGSYNVYLVITDSLGVQATSNTATVTADGALSVTASPSTVVMDVGQSQLFNSSVTGGASPYSYQWYLDGSPVSGATNASWTYTPSSPGSHNVYVKVTDAVSDVATSNTIPVTVNAELSASITPTSATLDLGQSQFFNSTVSGGTSPYSYQWYLNGAAVSGATSPSWTVTPPSTGSYTVDAKVTDSVSDTATSNTATVSVNAALSVTISPTSVTMDVGQNQTFTSSLSGGTGPYSYQWYLNGIAVSGATGASWSFRPSSSGSDTVYVMVTDSASTPSSATSNTAPVSVNPQLTISVSPSTATIYLSQSQNFTASPSGGTPPYTYQWYENGTLVSGATSSTWTFTPPSTGIYFIYVKATDSVGEVALSSNAQLTVEPKPSILVTINPNSAVIDLSQSVAFNSSVTGGKSPFTYQWYLNGSTVSGATSNAWTFAPISVGHYQVYLNVTDSLSNEARSNIAYVTVNSLPTVSISPTTVIMDLDQSHVFTSTVSGGTSPYSYQWYLDGSPVSGATSTSWTFTPSSAGNYTVYLTIKDTAGASATSNTASVNVNTAPVVTISPSPVTMDVGQSKTFTSIVLGGTSPYSYQWYLDNSPVFSATNASWNYKPSSPGSHTVYLKVTDAVNATTISNTVPVTVNGPLSVTILPTSVTLDVGQSKLFNSTVSGGTLPFTYQWYSNGSPTGTGATWAFTPSSAGSNSIYVNVTDAVGAVAKSNIAIVTVNRALSVSISPTAVVMDIGQSTTFTTTISGGTSPFSYQWYLNETSVSGATGSTWTFTPSSTGTYTVYVKVTDSASTDSSAQSNAAQVWVYAIPTVSISPSSSSIYLSQSVLFASSVSGGAPSYHYQWYLNGTAVAGAVSAFWTFQPTGTGTYFVYMNVTDGTGVTAKSNIARVTVTPAPHGVGGVSVSANAFSFLAPWLSVISLLAAVLLLRGIIVRKKRR
jgi:hypothetical protein